MAPAPYGSGRLSAIAAGRVLLRLLGRRLPRTDGTLRVSGPEETITIRRDEWGIPHIDARNDHDAWFGLGFCLGQDRSFQLELMLRAGRGTTAAMAGPEGLPLDRLSRRIGFDRASERALEVQDSGVRANIEAWVAGANAARADGVPVPHELTLARVTPTAWTARDFLNAGKLISFGLTTNWDIELGRLKVLTLDGPEALRAVDPDYAAWHVVTSPPGTPAGPAVDRLSEDVAALGALVGARGGSNNWTLSGSRTATGRPLLANDPHLDPTIPPLWYLVHLRTPEWELAGATVPGLTGVAVGHNGHAAWGATNGGADAADLFLEEIGPDGESVRGSDGLEPCTVHEETIEVRGGEPVVERVLETERGPIISPALPDEPPAVSLRAVFLEPEPLGGFARLERIRSFEELREAFRNWPAATANVVCADAGGTTGWQFAGWLPRRRRGFGTLPQPGWEVGEGWDGVVPFDELPWEKDPASGWIATANNKPVADGDGPFLGVDFMDGYRVHRIAEVLGEREDWDVPSCFQLQLDKVSLPWREMGPMLLELDPADHGRAARGLELLRDWDGVVAADSPAAAVWELFLAEMTIAVVGAKAPNSLEWALGKGQSQIITHTYIALARVSQISRLVRERPEGWFADGWDAPMRAALSAAVRTLEEEHGSDPRRWEWGRVRPLTLRHPLGERRPFRRAFNLGPIPYGGDTNTPAQASNPPVDPTGDPLYTGTLRAVMDVGAWDQSRFVLASGESGNPLSPHYRDQWEVWRRGEALPLPFSAEAVEAATRRTLTLEP